MSTTSTDRRNGVNIGSAIKVPCRAATTAAITLSGEQSVDGVSLVTGDRCLVKNQASGIDNGIYRVDSSSWQRDKDWDGSGEVKKGTMVFVHSGTVNEKSFWYVGTSDPIVIGTTSITFISTAVPSLFSFVGSVSAGGVAIELPAGWSSSLDGGTGIYTVTHNLGTTNYVFILTPNKATACFGMWKTKNANSIDIVFFTDAGVSTNAIFDFILVQW